MDIPVCEGAVEDDALRVIVLHQDAHNTLQLRSQRGATDFHRSVVCRFAPLVHYFAPSTLIRLALRRSTPRGHALALSTIPLLASEVCHALPHLRQRRLYLREPELHLHG